ncbi:hypothetical protein ABTZ58_27265 [Streptomyces sp. NPDC094143]|uniref:hypothetical protein n=1 Tax=Streptomyces sp. NPDC094143 TaxID=3155310 RepID=UPI003328943F
MSGSQIALITGGCWTPGTGRRHRAGRERLRAFAEERGHPARLLTIAGDTAVYDVRSVVDATRGTVAEVVRAMRRPAGVDVSTVVVRPVGQPVRQAGRAGNGGGPGPEPTGFGTGAPPVRVRLR